MQILSSKFSFVDFNEPPQTWVEEVVPIPAVDDFGIKFQFIVEDPEDGATFWAVPYNGNAITDAKVLATLACGSAGRMIMHAEIPAIDLDGYVPLYNCFQYAIYKGDPESDTSELLAVSNPFEAVRQTCWLSKLEYWSDENFADFNYAGDESLSNTVWLYMHLRSPSNPTKETVYVESTGKRRLLSAVMDEDYELKTDAFTQWLHRKIECALVHDYNRITNSHVGFVRELLSKSATYAKDWPDDAPGVNITSAKSRMIKNLNYTNSNCGESDCICTEPPTALNYSVGLYKNETVVKAAGWLMTGQESEGTLTTVAGTYVSPHGTFTIGANGSFTYVPNAGYLGADTFTYTMRNECGSDTASITFNTKNMEPGMIMEWGGLVANIPDGWLLCDYSEKSRTTYAALFAAIGTLHGPGNGSTTFNLPMIKKRVVAGFDADTAGYDVPGSTGGANSHTLSVNQLPKFRVKIFKEGDATSLNAAWPGAPRAIARKNTAEGSNSEYRFDPAAVGEANTGDSSQVGNDESFDLRNEFVVLPYIIKT